MIGWLRARTHLFAPIALVGALVALAIDWALGTHTRQETLVYAILGLGGVALLALKFGTWTRGRRD